MPWDYERIDEDGIDFIEAFQTDNPDERYRVYKFLPDEKVIEFYPKVSDGYPIKKIVLEGFIWLPKEFAEEGYIRGRGIQYYLSSKLGEKRFTSFIISKTRNNSIQKIRNKNEYKMVLSYSSFRYLKRIFNGIDSIAKQDRRNAIDNLFASIFPKHYKKKKLSGLNRAIRLVNSLDEKSIEFLNPQHISRLLDFFEVLLETKYRSIPKRRKLFGAAKIKINEVALNDVITQFEKMLSENLPESKWGEFLKKNLYLIESKYIELIPELNVVLAGSRKVDFGLIDSQGYLDLFEIKKPDTPILAKSIDRGNYYWNTYAVKAIMQAEKYLFNTTRKANPLIADIYRELDINVKIVRPRAVVIMGNRKQFDNDKKEEDFRILRSSLKNIEIILYDEMLESLKNQKKKIFKEYL